MTDLRLKPVKTFKFGSRVKGTPSIIELKQLKSLLIVLGYQSVDQIVPLIFIASANHTPLKVLAITSRKTLNLTSENFYFDIFAGSGHKRILVFHDRIVSFFNIRRSLEHTVDIYNESPINCQCIIQEQGVIVLPNNNLKPAGPGVNILDICSPAQKRKIMLPKYSSLKLNAMAYCQARGVLAITMVQNSSFSKAESVFVLLDLSSGIVLREIPAARDFIQLQYFSSDGLSMAYYFKKCMVEKTGLGQLLIKDGDFAEAAREEVFFPDDVDLVPSPLPRQAGSVRQVEVNISHQSVRILIKSISHCCAYKSLGANIWDSIQEVTSQGYGLGRNIQDEAVFYDLKGVEWTHASKFF